MSSPRRLEVGLRVRNDRLHQRQAGTAPAATASTANGRRREERRAVRGTRRAGRTDVNAANRQRTRHFSERDAPRSAASSHHAYLRVQEPHRGSTVRPSTCSAVASASRQASADGSASRRPVARRVAGRRAATRPIRAARGRRRVSQRGVDFRRASGSAPARRDVRRDVLAHGGADLVVGVAAVRPRSSTLERAQPLERRPLVLPRLPRGAAAGLPRPPAHAAPTPRTRAGASETTTSARPIEAARARTACRGAARAAVAERVSPAGSGSVLRNAIDRAGDLHLAGRRDVLQPLARTPRVVAHRQRLDRQRRHVHAIRRQHVAQAVGRPLRRVGRRRRVAARRPRGR